MLISGYRHAEMQMKMIFFFIPFALLISPSGNAYDVEGQSYVEAIRRSLVQEGSGGCAMSDDSDESDRMKEFLSKLNANDIASLKEVSIGPDQKAVDIVFRVNNKIVSVGLRSRGGVCVGYAAHWIVD